MLEFLTQLAERKYTLHHALYGSKTYAQTNQECFERIELKAKYEEVIHLIGYLPNKERKQVETIFKELTYTNHA